MIDPTSLGPAGRMVRCARCKTAWLAGGPKPRAEVTGFVENVIAEAEGRPASPPPPRLSAPPPVEDDFGDTDAEVTPPAAFGKRAEPPLEPIEAPPAAPVQSEPVSVMEQAPPLVPAPHEPPARTRDFESDDIESFAARRARMQAKRKTKRRSSKWTAVILLLFGFNVALVGARNEVVRFVPQTASLFAAIGLPVNLRHLVFQDVKVSKEESDGVNVLVVEGNIVSTTNNAVEVPRLRFGVRNPGGQEIYSWTAQPSRSVLGPGEQLPFRSRLASPPADANDVVVRFFTARDGVPGVK